MGEFVNPPDHGPIVIVEDGGGLVDKYEQAMLQYWIEKRRVEIKGSCRSACMMALAVPNVCVHRSAVVKVHQAYEPKTGIRHPEVTARMVNMMPARVKEHLSGHVTDWYNSTTTMSGTTLISLGIPECKTTRADR